MNLILKPFDKNLAKVITPWFDDAQTKKWLGNRTWVDNIFRLLNEPLGKEFRGSRSVGAYAYVAYNGEQPVGFIDAGIHDKWVKYGGEKDGKPVYLGVEEKLSAGFAFLIDPQQRRKGYGVAMIKALIKRPELKEVKLFGAGVEPANTGSIKTLEAAGFTSDYEPNFEDMIYFFYRR